MRRYLSVALELCRTVKHEIAQKLRRDRLQQFANMTVSLKMLIYRRSESLSEIVLGLLGSLPLRGIIDVETLSEPRSLIRHNNDADILESYNVINVMFPAGNLGVNGLRHFLALACFILANFYSCHWDRSFRVTESVLSNRILFSPSRLPLSEPELSSAQTPSAVRMDWRWDQDLERSGLRGAAFYRSLRGRGVA